MSIFKGIKLRRFVALSLTIVASAPIFFSSPSTAYADMDSSLEQTREAVEKIASGDDLMRIDHSIDINKEVIVAAEEYRKSPSMKNRSILWGLMSKSYDQSLINNRQELEFYRKNEDTHIKAWLNDVENGNMVPFIDIYTEKDLLYNEKQTVEKAVKAYWVYRTPESRDIMETSLREYYHAFLEIRSSALKHAEENKDVNIENAMQYFLNEKQNPLTTSKDMIEEEKNYSHDILLEFMTEHLLENPSISKEYAARAEELNVEVHNKLIAYQLNSSIENLDALKRVLKEVYKLAFNEHNDKIEFARKNLNKKSIEFINLLKDERTLDNMFDAVIHPRSVYGSALRNISHGKEAFPKWGERSAKLFFDIRDKGIDNQQVQLCIKNDYRLALDRQEGLTKIYDTHVDDYIKYTVRELTGVEK